MTALSTDPGGLRDGARTMVAGGGDALSAAVVVALRAVASAAGDAQLAEAAGRAADRWGAELTELEEHRRGFVSRLHTAGEAYAEAEASVIASVRRP